MKKKAGLISIGVILIIGTALITGAMPETVDKSENRTLPYSGSRLIDRRPSFWTKTGNNLKASTMLRIYKPHRNVTKLQKLVSHEPDNIVQNVTDFQEGETKSEAEENAKARTEDSDPESMTDDLEERIMKDESFIGLKELANQIVNDTVKFFTSKNASPRSYPGDEPPMMHQSWNDKDQSYHASTLSSDYEPPFHHHYPPPLPHHYYPASHKDDTVLTKFAIIALLKLILAKLKAIGFLKLMLVFMLKLPLLLFKFLFILKSFKLLKLISIPLIIFSFIAPFLPLIIIFAPVLFVPLLFIPLFLPLLIPLLFFLPIIPVSIPSNTRLKTGTRNGREATFNAPILEETGNSTKARFMRNRSRPASYENRKNFIEYKEKSNAYEAQEENLTLIELTQKLVDSQNCIERVACELATQNDSKIYQTAVVWALKKVHDLAMPKVKRKMERYMDAYKTGLKWRTSDICRNEFHCQRPKVLLIQGNSKYNVF